MDNVEDVYKNKKTRILLASVRIKDTNLVTYLNKEFALTREFYYGKILYADKQKCTIRVIRDLDTKRSIILKKKIFSTERTSVEFLPSDQIPIAEVYEDIITFNDIVKVPNNNYGRAQEFIKIVGNTVTFKTDQGTFDTANIMDTLVVHGQTKYLFSGSSFLYKWWEKNKKDVVKRREAEEASNRALKRLAEQAEQKEAEEAERAKQQAEEAKRKAEEAKKNRPKNKRKKKKEPERRSSRLENNKKKQRRRNPGRKARQKTSQLHEEYTEKLKF
tara:strand:+ start:643 stop:1464 length:822 start_codon:yes stop_codon:yes gene_type:complete